MPIFIGADYTGGVTMLRAVLLLVLTMGNDIDIALLLFCCYLSHDKSEFL